MQTLVIRTYQILGQGHRNSESPESQLLRTQRDIIHISLYFTRFSNIHNYSTRQSMMLSLPNVKRNFRKRTVLFTGANSCNKLPLNIVKSENI